MATSIRPQPSHTSGSHKNSTNTINKMHIDTNKGIWSSLLDSVSTGKKLDEKTVVMLGGSAESQIDFLDAISKNAATETPLPTFGHRRNIRDRNQRKPPPIANQFALGYTYQDVIGADQDDIICRLHVYMLADTRPAFTPLLSPLFTSQTIPNVLAVILLDWQEPWNWLRQLQDRIKMLRTVLDTKEGDCRTAMDETMEDWRERRRGPATEDAPAKAPEFNQSYPLGPGEWDEPLGVPLCVVCHNVERIEVLEKEHAWKDREFDTVMQYLRTVLLKHGGSLIYTASSDAGALQALIRSSLGIQVLHRKTTLKRNVTDRDKVLIPPNWDSWGNIRAQADEFDVEKVSKTWSVDIQMPLEKEASTGERSEGRNGNGSADAALGKDDESNSVVAVYEKAVSDPRYQHPSARNPTKKSKEPVFKCPDYQQFLSSQAERLERYKARDEAVAQRAPPKTPRSRYPTNPAEAGSLSDHLGPVQFNVGGIQVDAEAALEALQQRTTRRLVEEQQEQPRAAPAPPDERSEDEKMRAFFTALKVEGRGSSPAPTA